MKSSFKILRGIILGLGISFAAIALIMIVTPLYIFAYYPASIALILALSNIIISKRNSLNVKVPIFLSVFSVLLLATIVILQLRQVNEVASDVIIEKVLDEENKNVEQELDEVFGELE